MGLIELLMAVGLVGLVAAWRWSSRPPSSQPACGRCGYELHQPSTPRCPECGADLRTSGIITAAMGRTPLVGRRTGVLITVCLLLGPVVGLASWRASQRLMRPNAQRLDVSITVDQPTSGAYQTFVVEGSRTTRGDRMHFDPHCLRLVWNDGTRSEPLCLTPASRPVPSGRPMSGRPLIAEKDFPRERLDDWARDIGLDPSDRTISIELDDMHRIATRSLRDDLVVIGVPLDGLNGRVSGATGVHVILRTEPVIIGIGAGLLAVALGRTVVRRTVQRENNRRRDAARSILDGQSEP